VSSLLLYCAAIVILIGGVIIAQLTLRLRRERLAHLVASRDVLVSTAWFATALRSIGDAVITTDDEGLISFLNPMAEHLTGWSLQEARGRPVGEVFVTFDESTRQPISTPVDQVLRDGGPGGVASRVSLRRRDGAEIAIDDSAAPIRTDPTQRLAGVVLVFRDVTAQRRREVRKAFLMRATSELNSSLDYEHTLTTMARLAVPAIADWCAIDMTEGDSLRRLAVAHIDPSKVELVRTLERRYPPDPKAERGAARVLRTGQAELLSEISDELVEKAARDPGHLTILRALQLRSYIAAPIRRGARTLGVITLVMAESRRRYDEDDLSFACTLGERAAVAIENALIFREAERLRVDAEVASQAKDQFLAMLGHELRNPLAPIVTALELMNMRAEGVLERERGVIERQVKHLVRLVDDLLDVSRITSGKIELARETLDVSDVVADAIEMSAPFLEQRRHALHEQVPPGLLVDGDPARLTQIVANLLNNAAKFTEPGGTITIRAARVNGTIELAIRDTGKGIASDMLPRVFERFSQETQGIDRAQGGLGLGLAIVRGLVTLHGGTVEAHSGGVGRGTEVIVRLPASAASTEEHQVRQPPPTHTSGRGRVLIVDDNVDALELLAEAIADLGYETITATDGATALELAAHRHPDVALLDLGLPGMDGYELARRLHELEGLEQLRIVAVTGYGQSTDRTRTAAAGFEAHLVKPVGLDAVERLLATTQ
jgi:PAS domain S-box-containing protein